MQRLGDLTMDNEGGAYIKTGIARVQTIHRTLEFIAMRDDIAAFLSGRGMEGSTATLLLQRLQPFLQRYLRLADIYLDTLAEWHQSLLKLTSTLLTIGQELTDRGFCKPSELGDENKGQDEGMRDGTGIGEGSGNADVSKDITDESQVEGLRDQKEQEDVKTEEKHETDGAIEMEADFDADMEETQEGDQTEVEEEPPEDEPVSEEMAPLDRGDPNVVDEKLWGQESNHQQQAELGSDQEAVSKESKDTEIVAKDQRECAPSENHKREALSANDDPEDELQMEEAQPEDIGEQTKDDGRPVDDYVDQQEPLNLPDDLHIDDSRNETLQSISDDEDFMDGSENDVGDEEGDMNPSDHSGEETGGRDGEDAMEIEPQDGKQEQGENITAKADLREGEGTNLEGDDGQAEGVAPTTNQSGVETDNKDEVPESMAKEAQERTSQRYSNAPNYLSTSTNARAAMQIKVKVTLMLPRVRRPRLSTPPPN
jgi:midasin